MADKLWEVSWALFLTSDQFKNLSSAALAASVSAAAAAGIGLRRWTDFTDRKILAESRTTASGPGLDLAASGPVLDLVASETGPVQIGSAAAVAVLTTTVSDWTEDTEMVCLRSSEKTSFHQNGV